MLPNPFAPTLIEEPDTPLTNAHVILEDITLFRAKYSLFNNKYSKQHIQFQAEYLLDLAKVMTWVNSNKYLGNLHKKKWGENLFIVM